MFCCLRCARVRSSRGAFALLTFPVLVRCRQKKEREREERRRLEKKAEQDKIDEKLRAQRIKAERKEEQEQRDAARAQEETRRHWANQGGPASGERAAPQGGDAAAPLSAEAGPAHGSEDPHVQRALEVACALPAPSPRPCRQG